MQKKIIIIIPNWNGAIDLPASIDSILAQTYRHFGLVIVDNGSTDDSRAVIEAYKKQDARVEGIFLDKNYGYTGGVNPGIQLAIDQKAAYAAPFNNDARADKHWLGHLVEFLDTHPKYGIATCTFLHSDGKTIDSTGDLYTIWGLSFPRGRDQPAATHKQHSLDIFGASGGATLYRVSMLEKIGVFDEDFFAYYEDIDLSFRAQLRGWKVAYVAGAVAYHEQGKTSNRLAKRKEGNTTATPFLTEQFMKNLPYIIVKDVPAGLLWHVLPRFAFAYTIFFFRAMSDRRGMSAFRGIVLFWCRLPKKIVERRAIQKNRTVSNKYIWSLFVHDLPPNAYKLMRLRALWWRVTGRRAS
ncbi:MAG: glycosyltransferase family 2 protein [Candidatus Saccharimonadales bacterium]